MNAITPAPTAPGTRDFRIGGVAPREVARPADRAELCETLRRAARDRLAVVPWGGGVGLAHEAAPERYDLALDLGGIDRVVEHESEDFTITAECGVTLAALRARLSARGQELPLEAPHGARATLGGALAANASGPRRLRFGAPRDRILGARFALADGTLVRTGGKVVKNVAGYGIHRLLCGSRGGLAILVEASLKLATAPAARRALIYPAAEEVIADRARWAGLPRLEPAYLTVVSAGAAAELPAERAPRAGGSVIIGLEDDDAWVERQHEAIVHALGAPAARIENEAAERLARRLADLEGDGAPRLTFTSAANTPAALAGLAESHAGTFVFHAAAGRLHLLGADPGTAKATVARLAERGFALIDAAGVPGTAAALPPMVATLRLRERVRGALDPTRGLALGDRWERGGI